MRKLFITGTGSDVGKTLVTAGLQWQLRKAGRRARALKPVVSGYADGDETTDTAVLIRSGGGVVTPAAVEAMSPWRFSAPLAPNMAAAREGRTLALSDVVRFCGDAESPELDDLLVEGVGGVMSPITDDETVLEWIRSMDWPTLLVCGTYLGAISHCLTSLTALRAANIQVRAIIASESPNSTVDFASTIKSLTRLAPQALGSPVAIVPLARLDRAAEPWTSIPPLTHLIG